MQFMFSSIGSRFFFLLVQHQEHHVKQDRMHKICVGVKATCEPRHSDSLPLSLSLFLSKMEESSSFPREMLTGATAWMNHAFTLPRESNCKWKKGECITLQNSRKDETVLLQWKLYSCLGCPVECDNWKTWDIILQKQYFSIPWFKCGLYTC